MSERPAMTPALMTPARFAVLVAAYGAAPARWPAEERAAAEAFARAHPSLAGPLLEEALDLDDALEAARASATAPETAVARAVRALPQIVLFPLRAREAAVALAACAALGLGLGAALGATNRPGDAAAADAAFSAAFGGAESLSGVLGEGGGG